MKLPPVGADVFHAVRQTDIEMKKLIFVLRKSAKAPKNGSVISCEMSAYNVTDYVIHGRSSLYHRSIGNWHSVTKDVRLFSSVANTYSRNFIGCKNFVQ
jgi:hypothetical protein